MRNRATARLGKNNTNADGRNIQDYSQEFQYFEAVLGSQTAAHMHKKVGDTIKTTHGDPDGEGHGQEFTIVGVLEPTGTPNDRAAFINLEGFYLMEGHSRAFEDLANPDAEKSDVEVANVQPPRLPLEKRDLTAVLVKASRPMFAATMEKPINKRLHTQAVSPVKEVSTLIDTFIRPLQDVLLALTIVVCVVSSVSILVSIYNSMNERRRDIAVMRALGARRDAVVLVILLESLLIAVGGGVVGWLIGHGVGVACSGLIEDRTGIQIGFLNTITPIEWTLIPGLVILATIAGLVPALIAYRTNVSENLGT
ncbi:MAG: FtsX-like permease family protein [Pirellulaceae bacterium]